MSLSEYMVLLVPNTITMSNNVITDTDQQIIDKLKEDRCTPVLSVNCKKERESSPGDCLMCAGQHQQPLEKAGCSELDIKNWCQSA